MTSLHSWTRAAAHSDMRPEGPSYHSMDEENGRKDRVKALFAMIEGKPPERHDFMNIGIDTTRVPDGLDECLSGSQFRRKSS